MHPITTNRCRLPLSHTPSIHNSQWSVTYEYSCCYQQRFQAQGSLPASWHTVRCFYVRNAKLKRIERLYKRAVPLFGEVLTELDKLRSIPGHEEEKYVINRYSRNGCAVLVAPLDKIAVKSGIGKIVRPFDNMRASRSTEVHRDYGAMAESLWLGHSKEIAKECYLMVTDDDYAKAAGQKKSA